MMKPIDFPINPSPYNVGYCSDNFTSYPLCSVPAVARESAFDLSAEKLGFARAVYVCYGLAKWPSMSCRMFALELE